MSFPNGAKKVKRIFIADELRCGIRSFCLLADDETGRNDVSLGGGAVPEDAVGG
jgi:hypothetical protein